MEITELLTGDYEQIEVLRDEARGVLAFVAVHSTRLGPAFGGIRRWAYRRPAEALADALRLAEAMTLKCAAAGVPGGGGKAVILMHPETDREAAYRLLGRHVEQMRGRYYTGPDVGTEPRDLEVVAEHTRYVARPGPDGPGNLAEPTAIGVFAGIRAVAERLGHADLRGVHVAVQGLGEVGQRLVHLLRDAGARLTLSDVRREAVEAVAVPGDTIVDAGEIVSVEADVFAPCALGGVVHDLSLATLRARAIAGSANNVLTAPEHGEALFERGVLFAPDFVINSGALIQGALFHLEGRVPPRERIESIGERVGEILDTARERGVPPERIAYEFARERVAGANVERFIP